MDVPGERRLQDALRDLTAALNATGAHWMIIGGIAVIARGVRRFTADIDAAIRGDEISIGELLSALAENRILPRIDEAERFATESLVLLLRHEPSGVELDVSLAWTAFEHEAIEAATIELFGSVKTTMARAEDLVIFKAIAGRGKDIDDVVALLALYPDLDLVRVRARVRELAALAEAPELGRGLEAAIKSARGVTRPKKTKPRTTSKAPAKKRKRRVR